MKPLRALAAALALAVASSNATPYKAAAAPDFARHQATAATGAISGTAVDGDSGQPLAGAVIFLRGPRGQSGQVTDGKGRFLFEDLLESDRYILTATKAGYFELLSAGASTGVGNGRLPPVSLRSGEWVRDVRVIMRRAGSISGLVLSEGGVPLVDAYVRVLMQTPIAGRRQWTLGPVARTDDRGEYRIERLPAGNYYVQMLSVQETVPTATSTAELAGLSEAAIQSRENRGRSVSFDAAVMDVDALNQLVIGRYPIPPRGSDGRLLTYPMTFFPAGLMLREATRIALGPGEDRLGVDLRITPVPGSRVAGQLDGPPASYSGLTVRLVTADTEALGPGGEVATALVAADGRFTFVNVPAGAYVIVAQGVTTAYAMSNQVPELPAHPGVINGAGYVALSGPDGTVVRTYTTNPSGYWAREPIEVRAGEDLIGLVARMQHGVSVSGRFIWPGRPQSFAGGVSILNAEPAQGDAVLSVLAAQRDPTAPERFLIAGLMPGQYVLSASPLLVAQGTVLKSILCDGRNLTHAVIDTTSSSDLTDCDVTFSDQPSGLSGRVRDVGALGEVLGDVRVVVFPQEREQWLAIGLTPSRFKTAQAATDGSYHLANLPAGEYFLCAIRSDRLDGWMEPERLTSLAATALRVHLDWGKPASRDLTVDSRERR